MGLTGSDGYFFRANRAFLEMLGYTESELKTFKCSDITHPEDLKHEIPYIQQFSLFPIPYAISPTRVPKLPM
jgi:PAS domain S-box-containing protein